ncbi:Zinc knuckle CX2CX4HX4C [Penicillium chermesinum]|nr:Zinc knuckle CX2CX4HX4C [Penicillium chermesinum]
MSDVWEQAASGIDPWTPQDNDQSAALTQVESPSDGMLDICIHLTACICGYASDTGDEAHELEDYRPHDTTASSAHACRNCGSPHHLTRMCPENDAPRGRSPGPQDGPRGCYNCGEEGYAPISPMPSNPFTHASDSSPHASSSHMKSDCPNPPALAKSAKRRAIWPPSAPPAPRDICKNCLEEGHIAFECKANRKFDLGNVPDVLPEEAWELMKKASDVNDLDDFREAVKMYSKAVPDATWVDIEKKLREGKLRYYLIALIHDTMDVNTLIDLQGKLDRKYAISFQESQTPPRCFLRTRWPESP